ncbi:hypothetical protein BCR43DRAFT_459965 [Syncephalastrum racemosum]|uniref:E3 ubiquitin-protein ligase n=1 Tax=Syncephalastrum racemosum TaxID=13706 RepID=A0A1X2H720_SYNRA|nr:hypothetical protein BCR43DRAFT_459965 [Syncephalastrum racemosum]
MTESSKTSFVHPDQLRQFLVDAPALYSLPLDRSAERQILTNCYRSLWANNSQWLQEFFFKEASDQDDSLTSLLEKYNLFGHNEEPSTVLSANPDNVVVDKFEDEPEYWESQRGKQCGHLFKKGESVYRCRNCGLDDTCVLCSRCFHSTQHEGHDVKIWISRGAGGCCDCGDPEAWKVPLQCSIHSLSDPNTNITPPPASTTSITTATTSATDAAVDTATTSISSTYSASPAAVMSTPRTVKDIPIQLRHQIKSTIAVVLDYILETFAVSPEDVEPKSADEIIDESRDSDRALGTPANSRSSYACILWNDEKHSFDEVIGIVMQATRCSKQQATRVAESVDANGRHVVQVSSDLSHLLEMANRIRTIKLAVTVRSTRDTVREDMCALLLNWLKDLISGRYKFFGHVQGGNCIFRDIICETLCEDWSLSPQLAMLSTRYRRGRMSEVDQLFMYDTEDGPDSDEDEPVDTENPQLPDDFIENPELPEDIRDLARMLVDDDGLLNQFQAPHEDEWMDAGEDEREQAEDHGDEASFVDAEEHFEEDDPERRGSMQIDTDPADVQQEPPRRANEKSHTRDLIELRWELDAWLAYTAKLDQAERAIAKELGVPINSPPNISEVNWRIRKTFNSKLRLDYIMQYDLRLWKTPRSSIKDLLIGTLISNYDYRPIIGIRYARNYPEVVDAFFFKDREPEHSITSLSVQLLTVPTVAAMLVKEYKFFGMICSILTNFFLTDHIQLLLPQEYHQMQVNCASRAITRHRYAYTFFDLRYLLNAEAVKREVCQSPLYLRYFLDMLYQFQAMDPLIRRADVHVEYESNTWVSAFNVTLQVSKLCRLYSECFGALNEVLPPMEASRDLCRSICRVLKALMDWSPRLASADGVLRDGEDDSERPLVKGIRDQERRPLTTQHAGTFDVIRYNVATDPVSCHHPYHWLLAGLMEHVSLLREEYMAPLGWPNGFKDLVRSFDETHGDKTFLSIIEYPLRVRVLLAQASCNVWVRNGFGIRNQARTYRDISVRENTYDKDIYLLQVAFTAIDPDHLLVTMLDRFDIWDWFNGKPDKRHMYYDPSQVTYVVEEFLDLLVICATERSYASNMTIEDKIRRAIIQYLSLSSMAYSELVKVLPDSLSEHESFESLLGQLASYKAPAGLNDHGRYELKEQLYSEIDPYYWHFTKNQREEAFEKIRLRQKQAGDDSVESYFVRPHLRPIPFGPFKDLGRFLQSKMLCQIVVYGLWNCKTAATTKSDSILDDILYLAMLALTDKSKELDRKLGAQAKGKYREDRPHALDRGFIDYATEDAYPVVVDELERHPMTLLNILLHCLTDPGLGHVYKRCAVLIDTINVYGSVRAQETIQAWKELHPEMGGPVTPGSDNGMPEQERKKAAAKARQADIMKQFEQAQSQFMLQHADLYNDEEEPHTDEDVTMQKGGETTTDVERIFHFPSGTCIVCQEELDKSQTYGVLGLVQRSKNTRRAPLANPDVLLDIVETAQGQDTWATHMETSQEKKQIFHGLPGPPSESEGYPHISSCGHLMHASCFDNYQQTVQNDTMTAIQSLLPEFRRRQFLCPLCKALGNVLLPIVWKGKKESYPGPMQKRTPYEQLDQTALAIMDTLQTLPAAETDEDVLPYNMEELQALYNQLRGSMDAHQLLYRVDMNRLGRTSTIDLYDMFAYVLASIETAQRGEHGIRARDLTVEHTGTFLDYVSAQNQVLLKILAKTNELEPIVMDNGWATDEARPIDKVCVKTLQQIFVSQDESLLKQDLFTVLTRLSFALVTLQQRHTLEIVHLMRVLYLAEVTKVVVGFLQSFQQTNPALTDARVAASIAQFKERNDEAGVREFVTHVAHLLGLSDKAVQTAFEQIPPGAWGPVLRTCTLPFLRRSLLLMVSHQGLIPQTQDMSEVTDEYDRLVEMLHLPRIGDPLLAFEQEAMAAWCAPFQSRQPPQVILELPTPYYLVALPYRMDQLFDESARRVCRRCNTLPDYPALCLICGTFVCARRYCCTDNDLGECNLHMKSSHGDIGIYLVIKESFVLLLHRDGGTIMSAPYLDTHGEADLFLRRGTPQYLSPQRYEQIRQMWLSHGIPAFVRRKMEASYSYTRWESW